MDQPAPDSLSVRGTRLWTQITDDQLLDPVQLVILEEACRTADRLDELDRIIHGKGVLELMRFRVCDDEGSIVEVKFDNVLSEARQQQNVMKQLLVSLRLPDAQTGKRPQNRGTSRGAYDTSKTPPGVSSLDRARAAKAANE